MFVYSCNRTRERSKVINPGSEQLTVRKHFFYRNLPKFLKDSKQTSFHLARKYARLFTLHGCGKPLEVQEFEANSPPIVIEITTYNLIEKKKIILLCDVSLQLLA